MAKVTYGLADHIMAFTPEIRNRMLAAGIPETKISTVEMAVDTNTFSPQPVTEAAHLGLPDPKKKFTVLYAGAFALTYDFHTLLNAAKELKEEEILFIILGDGDAKKEIVETIRQYSLKNVLMPPPVSGPGMVAKYINYSDACVMPLKPEMVTSTITRPSKIFEFWACGKPLISCTKGEVEKLTHESGAGIAVTPGDTKGLVEAITTLYKDPELTRKMGTNAREFVVGRFSYETLKAAIENTFARFN